MCTLPWYWKVMILLYDVFKCWHLESRARQARPSTTSEIYTTALHITTAQIIFASVLLAPSMLFSVRERTETNAFISEMFLLLSSYLVFLVMMRQSAVPAEYLCFCMQFCSCYFFNCYVTALSRRKKLLVGNSGVRNACVFAMFIFPVMFGYSPEKCMHLSPHVLIFLFSGEASACLCTCVSYILTYIEFASDKFYVECFL